LHFVDRVGVVRYDVPNLAALNFVLPHVLGGGGSRSLRLDAQGKTLGMALLELYSSGAGTPRDHAADHDRRGAWSGDRRAGPG